MEAPKLASGSGATASGGTMDGKQDEILVNERALEMGLSFPLISREMVYGERMVAAARYASATQKGLWGACEVESSETPQGTWFITAPVTDCVIKGKLTRSADKIYRTPDCAAYGETVVIQAEGGRWFCAPDIAEDAGFVRAMDCVEE